jgi:hypothetical protein
MRNFADQLTTNAVAFITIVDLPDILKQVIF